MTQDKIRIMLLDEQPARFKVLEEALTAQGYRVVAKVTTADNIQAEVERSQPDVIIADLDNPGRDTLESMQAITRKRPRPIVMFTSDGDTQTIELAVKSGVTVKGTTAKLGIEALGSDGGLYGFATPLATLHAFQGWADQFLTTPAQGIEDVYVNLSRALFNGTATLVYHDYSADESTATVDDLGDEIDLQWVLPMRNNYQFWIEYADYRQGDLAAKTDKRVFWSWVQMTF